MQSQLFDDHSARQVRIHTLDDASLQEFPLAFTAQESAHYFQILRDRLPWQQATIRIAGRTIPIPRLQCWIGDENAHYSYSGIRLQPLPWNATLLELRNRVQILSQHNFNTALVNYYRDGQDSVSWHSDNERELGPDPVVASLSFGAERVFELKHKRKKSLGKIRIPLRNGCLLVMGKGLQSHWVHQLPKAKNLLEARINLTFRWVVPRTCNVGMARG